MVDNFTLSTTFLACLWLGNLPFFFFFFKSPSFLSHFYHFDDYCLFYKPRTHFQNLVCCVQNLGKMSQMEVKAPSVPGVFENKNGHELDGLEPVISVFGD